MPVEITFLPLARSRQIVSRLNQASVPGVAGLESGSAAM
jgi:hypothetical protein